jgi:hypothetical protein
VKIIRFEDLKNLPDSAFPEFRELTPEEMKEALALAKASFTAEDLQRYTELDLEEGVDAEEFLAELEEKQRALDQGSP